MVARILSSASKNRNLIIGDNKSLSITRALSGKLNSPALNNYILKNLNINKANVKKEINDNLTGNAKSQSLIEYAKTYFIKELVRINVDKELANRLGDNLKKILEEILVKSNNRIGEIDIFTSTKSATGFVAELVWGFDPQLTNINSKVIGRELDDRKKKLGSDIQITGKSGRVYFLQSKNTFYSRGPMFSGGGKLDTILGQLQQSQDLNFIEEEANFLKYLLLNAKIFNEADRLKQVSTLLSQGILHFLKIKSFNNLKLNFTKKQTNVANLFYIYKGTYLIPISDFLRTASRLIENLEGMYSINLSDIKLTYGDEDSSNLMERKNIEKANNPFKGPFPLGAYGEGVMSVGIKEGNRLSSETEIMNIKLVAKQIDMLLQQALLV